MPPMTAEQAEAAIAVGIEIAGQEIEAASRLLDEMATFEETGVSNRE